MGIREGKEEGIEEVIIEEDEPFAGEEWEIPVFVEEDEIDRSMLPEMPVQTYTEKAMADGKLPKLVICRESPKENAKLPMRLEAIAQPASIHAVKVEDAQRRLRTLPDYLLKEPGVGYKLAKAFGVNTERDRLRAFGEYFSDSIADKAVYLTPAQFLVKAEIALMKLKSGKEGQRPLRKSLRQLLVGKNEKFYEDIRSKLPEIARAVATTGFALELAEIYRDADRVGRTAFHYANDIKREKQMDELANKVRYGVFRLE